MGSLVPVPGPIYLRLMFMLEMKSEISLPHFEMKSISLLGVCCPGVTKIQSKALAGDIVGCDDAKLAVLCSQQV